MEKIGYTQELLPGGVISNSSNRLKYLWSSFGSMVLGAIVIIAALAAFFIFGMQTYKMKQVTTIEVPAHLVQQTPQGIIYLAPVPADSSKVKQITTEVPVLKDDDFKGKMNAFPSGIIITLISVIFLGAGVERQIQKSQENKLLAANPPDQPPCADPPNQP